MDLEKIVKEAIEESTGEELICPKCGQDLTLENSVKRTPLTRESDFGHIDGEDYDWDTPADIPVYNYYCDTCSTKINNLF